jgi:hypothetical protein
LSERSQAVAASSLSLARVSAAVPARPAALATAAVAAPAGRAVALGLGAGRFGSAPAWLALPVLAPAAMRTTAQADRARSNLRKARPRWPSPRRLRPPTSALCVAWKAWERNEATRMPQGTAGRSYYR